MSILVWIMPGGTLHYGYPLPHGLADLICRGCRGIRYLPGGSKLAYRLRIKEKSHA